MFETMPDTMEEMPWTTVKRHDNGDTTYTLEFNVTALFKPPIEIGILTVIDEDMIECHGDERVQKHMYTCTFEHWTEDTNWVKQECTSEDTRQAIDWCMCRLLQVFVQRFEIHEMVKHREAVLPIL